MARADLHRALALDSEIYQASQVDPSLLDPLVRVDGVLPGTARPITVVREYQGPQGGYVEQFRLTDRNGRVLYTSPTRRIQLRGEMFEDRFLSTVTGVRFEDVEEHTLTFYVDSEEVGSVPVFIEAGPGGDPYMALEQGLTKALQKSSIVWLSVPQPPDRRGRPTPPLEQAVWYVLERGKVYVFTGPGEQQVTGLPEAREVELIVRSKEDRSSIGRVPATVQRVPADDPVFDRVGRAGLGRRLNLPDGDAALDRWRNTLTLVELTPRFRPASAEPEAAQPSPAARASTAETPADGNGASPAEAKAKAKAAEEDIHVEAEIDQEVFNALMAEGKTERVARAKAKAAFVRREKARIRAERETVGS